MIRVRRHPYLGLRPRHSVVQLAEDFARSLRTLLMSICARKQGKREDVGDRAGKGTCTPVALWLEMPCGVRQKSHFLVKAAARRCNSCSSGFSSQNPLSRVDEKSPRTIWIRPATTTGQHALFVIRIEHDDSWVGWSFVRQMREASNRPIKTRLAALRIRQSTLPGRLKKQRSAKLAFLTPRNRDRNEWMSHETLEPGALL